MVIYLTTITLILLGGVGSFYIENIRELLDVDNEWFLDETNQILYYKPVNSSTPDASKFTVGILKNLIEIRGDSDSKVPVERVSLVGLTITCSAPTFLERYEVCITPQVG